MTHHTDKHIYGGDGINYEKIRRRKKLKKLAIIIGIPVLALAGLGTGAYFLFFSGPTSTPVANVTPADEPKPEPEPITYYSPLTGIEVKDEAATKQAVTAVIIENSPDARPQSGLKKSGVVFEAIAEGGITRFLVLYQQEKPSIVGPVRSVRHYFVDWLNPFNASIAHVGGSANALAVVRNGNYRDLDQFFYSQYYWRATDRYAPHNVYTNFEKLDALNKFKGYTSSSFTGFDRADDDKASTSKQKASNISISVNTGPTTSDAFTSTYTYDSNSKTYIRSVGGQPHLDREEGQINPRVVIAIMVDESTVLEDGWREKIGTIGADRAYIFQNGKVINGAWIKKSKGDQIYFIDDSSGKQKRVDLVRGQTWITAVPNNRGDVSWN
jgi:hypothetical protein